MMQYRKLPGWKFLALAVTGYLSLSTSSLQPVSLLDRTKLSQLPVRILEKYFVKIDPIGCGNGCAILDDTWSQFSEYMVPSSVWRLDCSDQRLLCQTFVGDRLEFLQMHRQPEIVVVSGNVLSDGCTLERYSGPHKVEDLLVFLQEAHARPLVPTPSSRIPYLNRMPRKPLLAILVLATDGLVRPDVWCPFLSHGGSLVRMFIHDKSRSGGPVCEGVDRVPTIVSQRETVSLVRASIQLLRHALAAGGADRYILVSGNSIPLFPAQEISNILTQYKDFSLLFQFHQQQDYETDTRFDTLRTDGQLQATREMFHKVSNWFVLDDDAARFLADEHNDYTRDFELVQMPDEHYFATLSERFELGWREAPIMYDVWRKKKSHHPKTLTEVSFKTRAGGHLFARKISKNTRIDLGLVTDSGPRSADEL